MDVDALAQEIRRVDGENELGAGALAEALMPFLAAAPTPAGKVRVKPLEWNGSDALFAPSLLGRYVVAHDGDEPEEWSYSLNARLLGSAATDEAAMGAAQAHHDRHILSALHPAAPKKQKRTI